MPKVDLPDLDSVRARIAEIEAERLAVDAAEMAAIQSRRADHCRDEYDRLQRFLKLYHVPKRRGPRKGAGLAEPTPLLDSPASVRAASGDYPNVDSASDATDAPSDQPEIGDDEPDNDLNDDPDNTVEVADIFCCKQCNNYRPMTVHPCRTCQSPEYKIIQIDRSEADELARVFAEEPVKSGRTKRVHPTGAI